MVRRPEILVRHVRLAVRVPVAPPPPYVAVRLNHAVHWAQNGPVHTMNAPETRAVNVIKPVMLGAAVITHLRVRQTRHVHTIRHIHIVQRNIMAVHAIRAAHVR